MTILNARIEELSQDVTGSFHQLADYQIQTERKIEERFNQVEARLDRIEATMATKEDIASVRAEMNAMEGRVLDAFKQLVAMIDSRLPPRSAHE
jgi:hypothetical protein